MKARRLAALLLTAALALPWGARTAFAAGEKTLASQAENLVDLYLWSGTPKAQAVGPITEAALLEKIPQYRYQDGALAAVEDIQHYPVSAGGRIFGIFVTLGDAGREDAASSEGPDEVSVTFSDGGQRYKVVYDNAPDGRFGDILPAEDDEGNGSSFSSEYAEALNDFAAKNDRLCVVYDDAGAYFLSPTAREMFQYGPGCSEDIFDDPTKDIFRDASVDLGTVGFWNAKNPQTLATLHFEPSAWERPEVVEVDEETLLRIDTTVLREDLVGIGDYGIYVGSQMRVYTASLRDYTQSGELSVGPLLFEGGQLYIGNVGDEGGFRGTITFTLEDSDAPGIHWYSPSADESLNLEDQKDKNRVVSLLSQRGIEADKEALSVKLVFVEEMGYLLLADTGTQKALLPTGLEGNDGTLFRGESGGVILLNDDFRAKAAAQLERDAAAEALAVLSSAEPSETVAGGPSADASAPERTNRAPVYLLGGGVLLIALAAGLMVYRKKKGH